ncbi:hypothetical protein [Cupriavidus pauculus]|uniref:hypothetical protein n=1 Tax=Cupriavidus pauculus TaxID=82633 RepID=UPI001FD37DBA|nr:hypothetical protein [Cupriavidus pauculus]
MSKGWNLLERRKEFFFRCLKFFPGFLFFLIFGAVTPAFSEDVYEINGRIIKIINNKSSHICALDNYPMYAIESYDKSAVMLSGRGYVGKNQLHTCALGQVVHVSLIPKGVGILSDINISKNIYVALDFVTVQPVMYLATVAHIGTKKNLVSMKGAYIPGKKASRSAQNAFVSDGAAGSSIISPDGRYVAPNGKVRCGEDAYPGVWDIVENKRIIVDGESCSALFSPKRVR